MLTTPSTAENQQLLGSDSFFKDQAVKVLEKKDPSTLMGSVEKLNTFLVDASIDVSIDIHKNYPMYLIDPARREDPSLSFRRSYRKAYYR